MGNTFEIRVWTQDHGFPVEGYRWVEFWRGESFRGMKRQLKKAKRIHDTVQMTWREDN